ncbi:MAG: hypothetical protein NTX75_14245 [Proteobacteria bacterium]|nr:hypothetical protein [Pseudomonadota bacterium]
MKKSVLAGTLFRSLLRCAFYPLQFRIALNFANSSSMNGTQTCELLPPQRETFILTEWVPKMLEGATREKFFQLMMKIVYLSRRLSIPELTLLLKLCEKRSPRTEKLHDDCKLEKLPG